jgi:ATPase subunit of ABC transporter with duplicated ATPase domains
MGHVDVAGVRFELPDGRLLLDDVSFRVGEGAKVALVGANGAGKTTLLRIVTGDLAPHAGVVSRSGALGVMSQMVGRGAQPVAELLLSVAPSRVRHAAAEVERLELALMESEDDATQMRYAHALAEWGDAGGYDIEVTWDVVCEHLELSGLMRPFDLEVWYGERVAVLGSNGSGKSHFLRLLASGGSDPDVEHRPVGDVEILPVSHTGRARLGARVRPGWFVQTHAHPELTGRTLLEILHRGDAHRAGMPREQASRRLDRYELAGAAEQRFESLSGGQQARFQILLLELSGATLLLLDEPTDNLDLESAEALEEGLAAYEGTVLAVTHDRWFARGFDRFVVFGSDGTVYEAPEPVWDERRVDRVR